MKNIIDIKSRYREYVNNHWMASRGGDYKLANRMYSKLLKIYKELDKNKNEATIFLEEMLTDKSFAVQMWAASDCLGLGILIKKAIETLEMISLKNADEAPRFEAEMVLKEWKKNREM